MTKKSTQSAREAPTPFEPLSLDDLKTKLSKLSIASIAKDLADQGDTARLLHLVGGIALGDASRLDKTLVFKLFYVADHALLPELSERIDLACKALPAGSADSDMGMLLSRLCFDALARKLAKDDQACELSIEKCLRLASWRNPIAGVSTPSAHNAFGEAMLPKCKEAPLLSEAASAEIQGLHASQSSFHALAPAIALGERGDGRVFDALLARDDMKAALARAFSSHNDFTRNNHNLGPFIVLNSPDFWKRSASFGKRLALLAQKDNPNFEIPSPVHKAMLSACEADPKHPAFALLAEQFGPAGALANHLHKGGLATIEAAFNTASAMIASLEGADEAISRIVDAFLSSRPSGSTARDHVAFLRKALFHPNEQASRIVAERVEAAKGKSAFVECLSNANIEAFIDAARRCERPQATRDALDAIGLELALSFPGHRKGMDSSILMWFAEKSELTIFEAALDWFASKGALAEQASSKSWVFNNGITRKKGDLLAYCVALGKTGHAKALMARLPDIDTAYSREVAKAMSANANPQQGAVALSAWEQILLGKVLEARSANAPSPKSRSL